jgi:hypothetical protein
MEGFNVIWTALLVLSNLGTSGEAKIYNNIALAAGNSSNVS